MSKIVLDVVDDENRSEFVESAQKVGLTVDLLSEKGPGGGNPCYEVSGERDVIEGWLVCIGYPADAEDLEYLMSTVVE